MTGYGAEPSNFYPNDNMTRGMLVHTLYLIEGSPNAAGMQSIFEDVTEDMLYTDAIKWASANRIVLGYGDGLFGPDDPVTREQFAAILSRYADYCEIQLPDLRENIIFIDEEDIAYYAKPAVAQLYKAEIIEGKPGNVFVPIGSISRAEAAAILRRFMES